MPKKPSKPRPKKSEPVFMETWNPDDIEKLARKAERLKKRKKLKAKLQRRYGRGSK